MVETNEEDKAATRIQAIHRGRATRHHLKKTKVEAKAATKIQAVHRGKAARRRVEALKRGEIPDPGVAKCVLFIQPEGVAYQKTLPLDKSIRELLEMLSEELQLEQNSLSLLHNGKKIKPYTNLAGCGLQDGDVAELELLVEVQQPETSAHQQTGGEEQYLEVEVDFEDGSEPRIIQVFVENVQKGQMPWLGGFRNKRTNVNYLHATCQTDRKPKVYEKDRQFSRDTQTYEVKMRTQQSVRDAGTQMARPDLLLDDNMDREMLSGRYMTSEEHHLLRVKKTIVLQRYSRGWKARKRAAELRRKREERQAFLWAEAERMQAEAEERRRAEIERRMRPRTTADFEILYNELEAWRLQETQKIKEAGLAEEERHAALQQLLHKETKLLQTIDRLKIAANGENRDVRIAHTLSDMAAPKTWEIADGTTVEVHTPFTTRSKELMQLYNGLRLPLLTTDERLDVLLHTKWTVKEFDCNLSREIVELIDREADLLNRGRNPKSMDGLRRRIANLFLQFTETPEFNPEATRYQIIAGDFEMELPVKPRYRNAKSTQTIVA